MKIAIKILSLTLCFLLILSMLIACDDTPDKAAESTTTPTTTVTTEAPTPEEEPENDGDKSASKKPSTENMDISSLSLDYFPLNDGTYGVKVGNALYLEKVVIPAEYNGKPVTQILPQAFNLDTNLKTIEIPDTITSIGNNAFDTCTSLASITIPNSVTSIGEQAFADCDALTSITIPNSVTSIGESAFVWSGNLADIYFTGSEAEWNALNVYFNVSNPTIHYNCTPN